MLVATIDQNTNSAGQVSFDVTGTFSSTSRLYFVASSMNSSTDIVTIDNISVTATKSVDADPGNNYSVNYTEQQATPLAIASTPLITDPDIGDKVFSANIHIRDAVTGDRLDVGTLPTGIVATGGGTGTVVLNSVLGSSQADFQTALAAITFSNPGDNPTNADRHIDVTVNDGFRDSGVATTTVHVTAVDDASIAAADVIVTNFGGNNNTSSSVTFTVPDWALLANDTDVDSTPSINSLSINSSSLRTASHSNQTVTIQDNALLGGSFNYSLSGTGNPTATVTVQQTTSGGITVAGNNITDNNGSHILVGNEANNTITGNGGNDIVFANGGDDTIVTGGGNDYIDGGTGADSMTGGDGNDTYVIDDTSVSGGNLATRDQVLLEMANGGTDTVTGAISLDLANYANVENIILTGSGSNSATGNVANNVITGNSGNNTISAGGGDDTIIYNVSGGRDIVDGGTNGTAAGDTFVVNGDGSSETFRIYTATEWTALGGNGNNAHSLQNSASEIVITRQTGNNPGTPSNGNVIAELRNVEELVINTGAGNDTVTIAGNFDPTHLNYNTIHINDADGGDSVDITGLTSAHRIVFNTDAAGQVVGDIRAQDVVNHSDMNGAPSGDPGNGSSGGQPSNGQEEDDDNEHLNRAPVVNGPIVLPSLGVNTPLLLAAAVLLAGASDADGDALTVTNLTPSSGTVTQGLDGWTFTPATDDTSQVSFSYDISDGHASVHQTALLDLTAAAGGEGDGADAPVLGGDAHLGTDGADVIIGGLGADVLSGGQGDDVILGNDGADTLLGGAGDDAAGDDAAEIRFCECSTADHVTPGMT